MSRRIRWGAFTRGVVGYGVFIAVATHFLSHPEPYDTADLIRVALGILGLQAGLGKESIVTTIDAITRFMEAIPGWWRRRTQTTEHPVVPLFPPSEPNTVIRERTKRVRKTARKPKTARRAKS